ncbi:MAG TPA: acyltransferase [Candidatus Corynebacterium avicola]|uniref:Acyltransferase n=1 Tax=Candidatus Corynebacterium avicola TaxID=2838527 RepID=A0A9D1RQN4_9CORY|nr:acyltransferase [Candidatus Corynebacterium avicola]
MPATNRVAWIDTVKGAAILLVVLMHVATAASSQEWFDARVLDAMSPLRTVRMPLFFAMAGYFFLRRIDRPWPWQVQNRLGPFLWLFLLWSALWAIWAQFFPWNDDSYTVQTVLAVPVNPEYGPWFIYALAIYYLVVKLMRPLPLWLQFALGACVSLPVAFGLVTIDNFAWERTLTHLIVFQFGVYGHRIIAAIAERASVATLALVGGAWAAGFVALIGLGGPLTSPAWLPLTMLGMAMGIIAATLIARHMPWLRLDWFGRNTLPVYLLHFPVIGVLFMLWPMDDSSSTLSAPQSAVVTVAFTVAAVAGAFLLWWLLRPVPGLFISPWRGEGANTRPMRPAPGEAKVHDGGRHRGHPRGQTGPTSTSEQTGRSRAPRKSG